MQYVIDLIETHHDLVIIVLTVLLAAVTYGLFKSTESMASATLALATEATNAAKSTNRHHRQALSPCVSYECTITYMPADEEFGPRIKLWGALSNLGKGVAIDVRWEIRVVGVTNPITSQYSNLPAGRIGLYSTHYFPISERLGTNAFEPRFTLELNYLNVFGDSLKTTMSCDGEGLPLVMNYDMGVLSESSLS